MEENFDCEVERAEFKQQRTEADKAEAYYVPSVRHCIQLALPQPALRPPGRAIHSVTIGSRLMHSRRLCLE